VSLISKLRPISEDALDRRKQSTCWVGRPLSVWLGLEKFRNFFSCFMNKTAVNDRLKQLLEDLNVVVDAGETEAFKPAMPSDCKKWSGVLHPGGLHSIYCSSMVKMGCVLFSEQD
jgi:hypothetical protein